ncbi:DUF3857 domain-containing protein [Algoriphagus halophytocola]|uniref:DUF3857 domain-containing protein n=1 Tax=Algoriphagus halophytocola TaxID=2991499 RepID=UPI0022DDABC8|nr:DUF3857 domain-containing protein [Algoriphagus sp. TR-M9]WBL42673.1 DUF3857 domain-containing protein [Algoriphagus sp. TR-M9]
MNKTVLTFALTFLSLASFSQTLKFGKFEESELSLSEVPFEPDAPAVILATQGSSKFGSGLLETSNFVRIKILAEAGKEYADVRVRYYSGDSNTESINRVKAQTTNFVDGKEEVTKVSGDGIFTVDLADGYKEMRITFPNVQVGSIIEYQYSKFDKNLTFIDGWTFQNEIPTLYSKYEINIPESLDYRSIGQGENFSTNVEKTDEYGNYGWILRDLRSVKEEPYMKNYRDYVDRIEFQLARYKTNSTTSGIGWEDVLNTWEVLGDEVISIYSQNGYYRSNPIEKEFLDVDLSGATEAETAEKAYYYVRDNFKIVGEDWIYPEQNLNQLLKSKVGSPLEVMLTLMGVLKSVGIACEPVLIGSKGYGRSNLVPFPFLNQFDEVLLLAVLDGKPQFIDLSLSDAPFGYVDLDKHVKGGLYLAEKESKLIPIEIQHNSNTVYYSQVAINEEGELVMKSSHRNYMYRGLNLSHRIESIQKNQESLETLFKKNAAVVYEDFKVENELQEKDHLTLSFQMKYPESHNKDMLLFNPIKFSNFSENPFTQEYRIFPVDFGYAFSETYNTMISVPEGYEVDDYPLEESIAIPGGYVQFIYSSKLLGNNLNISGRLVVNNPLIPASEYPNLKYFMESVASKLAEPVVLKKKSDPIPSI